MIKRLTEKLSLLGIIKVWFASSQNALLAMTCSLLLCSCSFLSPVKLSSTNTYLLNTVPHVDSKRTRSMTVIIPLPETRPIYNTRQMAYTTKPYQVAYYGQNQWAETPGQMLQLLLVQTLQNTHRFRAVVTPPYIGRYRYSLNTQIIKIEQDYTRLPVANIIVNAQIIYAMTNQVIATKQFSVSIPLRERNPYVGVVAMNMAMSAVVKEITEFSVQKMR